MKKINLLCLFFLLSSFAVYAQTINSDTYIVTQEDVYWVYDGGTFTLHNKNTDTDVVFYHLTIADDGFLHVSSETALTINGNLVQGSGSDKLVLRSDEDGTASLLTHGTVSGQSVSEKFLKSGNTHGYTIASPVNGAPHSTFTGHINTYFYNAEDAVWELIDVNSGSMENMRGYWTKFTDDKTLEFKAVLNTGAVSFTDLYRAAVGQGNMGWNFLGNPYPSSILWDEVVDENGGETDFVSITKLNNAVHISNNAGGYLSYVNGAGQSGFNDGVIPAHASFWVQVNKDYYDPNTAPGPVLNAKLEFDNSVRVHENLYEPPPPSKTSHSGVMRLALQRDNYQDEIVVRLRDGATVDFDPAFDAPKMFASASAIPQFFMKLPYDNKLSIYSLPENLALPHLIPLGVKSTAGQSHKIQINLNEFTPYSHIDIHLEDKATGVFADLRLNDTYTYTAISNDEDQRFVLHLGAFTAIDEGESLTALNIYAHHNHIYVAGLDERATLRLFNMLGQEIMHTQLEPGSHIVSTDVPVGYYIVRITGNQKMETQKIFLETIN